MTDMDARDDVWDQGGEVRARWFEIWKTSWLWGGLLTCGFYAAIPALPVAYRTPLGRYFCSHPVEYGEAGLFFVALIDLLAKAWRLRRDRRAFDALPVSSSGPASESAVAAADMLTGRCRSVPAALRNSVWCRRLRDVAAFVRNRSSSDRLDDHLSELALREEDRLQDSFSLLQTVIWAIPIVGFLGTVLGITLAIAHITPEQLESSLDDVTGGLAVAFDTTAVALAQSLVLVFGQWSVKRSAMRVLSDADRLSRSLCHREFPQVSHASPLQQAEAEAAQALVERTELLIGQQTRLWTESIERLRSKWTETLESHRTQLSSSLADGTERTWSDHRTQMTAARDEFVHAYRDVARQLTEGLARSESSRAGQDATLARQLSEFWQRMQAESHAMQTAQQALAQSSVQELASHVEQWQAQMAAMMETVRLQMASMADQSRLLGRIVESEEHLAGLEHRLVQNLDAVRTAETFEQTLHSLNAAVHLLTARQTARAA